jgi:hypothetical protein
MFSVRQSPDRNKFVVAWSGRVGEEIAELSVSSARAIGFGGLLVPVWTVLFVVGSHTPAVVGLAIAVLIADLILLTRGVVLQHRMHSLMRERFQTRVSFLNSPSLREGQFQAWCQRHGVNPDTGRPSAHNDSASRSPASSND